MVGRIRRMERSLSGWTLALTSVGFFMVALDALVVITALPVIHRELGAGLATLEWSVNAYLLVFAAGIISAAALGDRFGRRRVYVAGLLLFTVASAACAMAPTASWLIAARAIQGLGAAVVTPLSLTILTTGFSPERRGSIVGIWGGIAGLAIAAGPLVGGAVTQGMSWHWIFWVNVPIGLAAALLSLVRLDESRGPRTGLDLAGVTLASGAAGTLVWALVHANEVGWSNPQIVIALGLGLVSVVGFVAWEGHASAPMVPLRLFRIRAFAAANVTIVFMTAAIFSAAFLMSQFFQLALGYDALATGVRFLPWTATPLIVAPIAGAVSDKVGTLPFMAAGLTLQAAGLGWIAVVAATNVGYGPLLLPLMVAGIGISMALPTTPVAGLSAVEPPEVGKASGVLNTLQRFGGALGVAVVSAVFTANGNLSTSESLYAGFRPALWVAAAFSLLGAASALAVTPRRAAKKGKLQDSSTSSPVAITRPSSHRDSTLPSENC